MIMCLAQAHCRQQRRLGPPHLTLCSEFQKPTRLECMMQDYPKLLPGDAKVGFCQFERWTSFSALKNSISAGRQNQAAGVGHYCSGPAAAVIVVVAVNSGVFFPSAPHNLSICVSFFLGRRLPLQNAAECAATAEADQLAWGRRVLSEAGVQVEQGSEATYAGVTVEQGACVVLAPSFGTTQEEIRKKFLGESFLSARSTLVLDGEVSSHRQPSAGCSLGKLLYFPVRRPYKNHCFFDLLKFRSRFQQDITVESLQLDGVLWVQAMPGAQVGLFFLLPLHNWNVAMDIVDFCLSLPCSIFALPTLCQQNLRSTSGTSTSVTRNPGVSRTFRRSMTPRFLLWMLSAAISCPKANWWMSCTVSISLASMYSRTTPWRISSPPRRRCRGSVEGGFDRTLDRISINPRQ